MVDKFNYTIEGIQVNAESITVPSGSPYKVLTVHDHIKKDEVSTVEIWENNDKSGNQLTEETYTGTVSGTGKFQIDYEGAEENTGIKRCSTVLFHSAQAGTSWYIWYKSTGDEAEAGDINNKADKDSDAVENNLAKFDSSGNPVDSGIDPADLALRDADATEGNIAKFDSNKDPVDAGIAYGNIAIKNITINEQTGSSYTLALADNNKLVDCNYETAFTLTVPLNSAVAFPIGTQILIRQKGAGQVTITPADGVTLNSPDSVDATIAQYSMAGLIKVATDTWALFGDLE